ncbi:hypothetical protein PHLGIDRAFT_379543 [Phlebiopsis gigantea 11061_1 CR5-6]|uniref:C2H2-type domain-containing protein n=1 Tax=Phlebiopsis gigantea (strain 11061_1 CR5-6) TaxID=745531 RepID=A0A0C3N9N3_PHLG1|nr:hypothetical protein PHLGIDRAFT_379543 [Phlebiopsis gigantea 11061_1 CR5-6]
MSRTSKCPARGERVTPKLQWTNGNSQPCQVCGVEIFDCEHWIDHIVAHKRKLFDGCKYQCPLCPRTSEDWSPLLIHMGRHFPGYKPYQCKELIQVVDPLDPTSFTPVQCTHREVDPSRLNLHRVKVHGHQRKKKTPSTGEISSCGQAVRRSRGRASRKMTPYQQSKVYALPSPQEPCQLSPFDSSYASSSCLTLESPQYPVGHTYNCATPESSSSPSSADSCSTYSTPSPTYSGATSPSPSPSPLSTYYICPTPDYSSASSPDSVCFPGSSSTFSTPSPTYSGTTSPSPCSSPAYSWDTPLPLPSCETLLPPSSEGLSTVSLDDAQLDSLVLWLDGISPEARRTLDEDLDAFIKTFGVDCNDSS